MYLKIAQIEFAKEVLGVEMNSILAKLKSHGYIIIIDSDHNNNVYYLAKNIEGDD